MVHAYDALLIAQGPHIAFAFENAHALIFRSTRTVRTAPVPAAQNRKIGRAPSQFGGVRSLQKSGRLIRPGLALDDRSAAAGTLSPEFFDLDQESTACGSDHSSIAKSDRSSITTADQFDPLEFLFRRNFLAGAAPPKWYVMIEV